MKTFAKLSILLGALLVVGFFGGGALLPKTFSIQRSQRIAAPAEEVYTLVGHLDRWTEWTAWNAEEIPGLEISVPGTSEGTGATQLWKMGEREGTLTITSAEAARGIFYSFILEGQPKSEGIITFVTAGSFTEVVWQIRGSLENSTERWLGTLLDGRLGGQMEEGLDRLKARFAP